MQRDDRSSYLFLCGKKTQEECFRRKLFGRGKEQEEVVRSIRAGSTLFLYNLRSSDLIGPFTATTNGGWMLDPEAWSSVLPLSFPAQIKVKWTKLKILENAGEKFAFLDKKVCRLDAVQTANILSALECAPDFNPAMKEGALIPEAENRFMKFLNAKGIGFIRFSQYLDDFSRILKSFKAKRPDFIAFSGTALLIEVKPHPCSDEVTLEVDEVEKLKQLELLTHLKTIIAFPADTQGIEWKHVSPFVLWAHGDKKTVYNKQVLSIKTSMLDQFAL